MKSPALNGRGSFNFRAITKLYNRGGLGYLIKKNMLQTLLLFFTLVLAVSACSSEPKTKVTATPSASIEVVAETTLLSTLPDNEQFEVYNPTIHAKTFFDAVVNQAGRGFAYLAKKADKVYVVHNGKSGPLYDIIFNL